MLRDFLTPEAFEIGIIRYLKRYSYQNTVNSHLWESLTNVRIYFYVIFLNCWKCYSVDCHIDIRSQCLHSTSQTLTGVTVRGQSQNVNCVEESCQ